VEERTIRKRIRDFRWNVRRLVFACPFVIAVTVVDSRALLPVVARGPETRALGMDRSSFALAFETPVGGAGMTRWRFDAGEWTLFEIDGLGVCACTGEVRRGRWGGIFAAAVVSSPVGREGEFSGALLAAGRGCVALAGDVTLETVALDGCRKTARVSLSIDAVVRFSNELVMSSRVGGIRLGGEPSRGADACVLVAALPSRPMCGVIGISVSRRGDVACGVSSRIRIGRSLRAALGYDDGTASINGSLSLGVRTVVFEAGASIHPVLGVSKAFFVSWRRGLWD
jgi:hypothetical protein